MAKDKTAEGEIAGSGTAGDGPQTQGPGRFGKSFLTDIWYFAALSGDLKPGRLVRHEILGSPMLLGRAPGGALVALRDICPHRAAPLSAGRFCQEADGATTVECPYHGWRFGVDGRCRAIPSLVAGQAFETDRIGVRAYPVAESQGLVFVWIGGAGGSPPETSPPVFPGVTGGAPKLVLRRRFETHIDHAVVGLMDPAHGPYVHRQWWWRAAGTAHEKAKAFAPTEAGFTMLRHPPSSNSRAYALLGGTPSTEITFRLPGLRWEHVRVGKRQVLALTCLTPVSETATDVTQIFWSDHPIFALARPLIALAAQRFLKQDADVTDLQNLNLPYDPRFLWIDDADRQARWYQALKREWAASVQAGRAFVNPVTATTLKWIS